MIRLYSNLFSDYDFLSFPFFTINKIAKMIAIRYPHIPVIRITIFIEFFSVYGLGYGFGVGDESINWNNFIVL